MASLNICSCPEQYCITYIESDCASTALAPIDPERFMQMFRDTLDACGLNDIGYIGDMFTCRRGGIRERLDRALGNSRWINMQENAALVHLDWFTSSKIFVTWLNNLFLGWFKLY
jgi:hypothetical protein